MSTIRGADKIFVLHQGQVVEEGTHKELMALKKEYYALVTAQISRAETEDMSSGTKSPSGKHVEFEDEDRKSNEREESEVRNYFLFFMYVYNFFKN